MKMFNGQDLDGRVLLSMRPTDGTARPRTGSFGGGGSGRRRLRHCRGGTAVVAAGVLMPSYQTKTRKGFGCVISNNITWLEDKLAVSLCPFDLQVINGRVGFYQEGDAGIFLIS